MKYKGIKIRPSKNGKSWFARFRQNKKQHYVSDKTQIGCYNKVKYLWNNPKVIEESKINNITLLDWYNKWLELYKSDVRKTTIADYKASLNYMNNILNCKLCDLTSLQINEMLANIEFERRKQKVYELLHDLLGKAVSNEVIDKNPLASILKPKHKRKSGEALSNEDEAVLESYFKEKCLDIFLICLYQGLRKSEMLALTIDDVDFKNKLLNINKSLDAYNVLGKTKNESSERIQPLLDKTLKIFEKYRNCTGRIFNISQKQCQKLFEKSLAECNITKKYTIHSLRHTFITRCQEEKIPLHIIQKWVGHVPGSKVTSEIYTHARTQAELLYYNIINK